jgi:hypothetical protein
MNKRDFLLKGSTWLGGASALALSGPGGAQASASASPSALQTAPLTGPVRRADWQTWLGQTFVGTTPVGLMCEMTLAEVSQAADHLSAHALEQFTLRFQGPISRRLQEGVQTLLHPEIGPVTVYLQAVAPSSSASTAAAPHVAQYAAHFSLLA